MATIPPCAWPIPVEYPSWAPSGSEALGVGLADVANLDSPEATRGGARLS